MVRTLTFALKFFLTLFMSLSASAQQTLGGTTTASRAQATLKGPSSISPSPTTLAAMDSVALSPEALSAKSLLEELIVRRYTQELSTRLTRERFSVSAQLELISIKNEEIPAVEPISDLMLGTLDPEELTKRLAGAEAADVAARLLAQYRIRTVLLTVGLSEALPEDKRSETGKWIDSRVKKQFGTNGKTEINSLFTESLAPSTPPPKTWWDWLKELQELAGQIVLALALILGALIWALFNSRSAQEAASNAINLSTSAQDGAKGLGGESSLSLERRKSEDQNLATQIGELTSKLTGFLPKVSGDLEPVIRTWCQQGESGRFRLACFAEAVGQDIGKLPIPVDALADITKVFAQMPNVNLREKRDALQKAYWDLLAAMNLGSEALNQPFSYMGGLNVEAVSSVLMGQNPKLRTMVALYLPEDLRQRYLKTLDSAAKIDLLQSAAGLNQVAAQELREADGSLATQLRGRGKNSEIIELDMTVQKIVAGLTAEEEASLLKGLTGKMIDLYKKSAASLAFLDEWPDDSLTRLISRCSVDQIVAYMRVRPDTMDRLLALSPPLTAQMAKDELSRKDNLSQNDRNRLLESLREIIRTMQADKEIDLEAIFTPRTPAEPNYPPQAA